MLQIVDVVDVSATTRPEVDVAATEIGAVPNVADAGSVNVIVCGDLVIAKLRSIATAGA